ncbi:MAG: Uma2 family endonuclease [Anaerolineae bacterium]
MVFQAQIASVTIEQFREIVMLPENAERLFELINGEMIEKMPGRTSTSQFPLKLASSVIVHCKTQTLPCYVSGADGAYQVGGDVVAPDFAYKPTPMSEEYPDPVAPLWAVEVISPTDKAANIRSKRQIDLDANILLWELYPHLRRVDVYAPGEPPTSFQMGETLNVGDLLPGFTLAVEEIFGE